MNLRFSTVVTILLLLGVQKVAWAKAASVGFSEYRLLLTKQNKTNELSLFNKGNQDASCDVGLSHYNVREDNTIFPQSDSDKVYQPANKLLRYSPRRVILPPGSRQKVRLTFRRKANLADGEYISYLNLVCTEKSAQDSKGGEVGAVISYNIPVHVRTGELQASTKLELRSVQKNTDGVYNISIRQYREGNRSLVGDLKMMDVKNDQLLGLKANLAVYPPAAYAEYQYTVNTKPTQGILFQFEESKDYQGEQTASLTIPASAFK